jgi:MYXO-CTERM domain-containing protein
MANGAGSSVDEEPLIYGGTEVAPCGWPTTVFLGGCTGTLVHPEVVIYAAHCGNVGQVRFGENGQSGPGRSVATKYCETNPSYGGGGSGQDHAFCVLNEPQTDVPIVPILMGCETQILQPSKEVAIVGYGNADNGPFGIKREVYTTINSVGNEAFIGGNGKDSCQGDSGGPVYVKLTADEGADETWRVFGITSYGGACGTGGYYSMMHIGMEWIEGQLESEGIDITPCHDSDGTWNPTIDCFGFPQDPAPGYGGWSDGCDPGPLGAWSTVCGDPFNDEPDDTPPSVVITSPEQQQMFDTMGGDSALVPVSVSADDMDGWGVKQVELLVDDDIVQGSALFQPPYEWGNLQFPPGQYKIGAIAEDYAGNVGMATDIYIGVDMEAEEPPADTGGDGDGDGTGDGPDGTGTGPMGEGDSGEDDGGKGCGCSTSPANGGGWALLSLIGLVAFRRRRAA